MTPVAVAIVTTSHWEGDPRLNRHLEYLRQSGHQASLTTFAGQRRGTALWSALKSIAATASTHVLLPDPELYFPGSVVARLTGKKPVIDIHEDYPRAAMARRWVPDWARPVVRLLAALAVAAGRLASWRVLVAAPELARRGDRVALNIPNPASLQLTPHDGSHRLVYIGDVTEARGAAEMVETLAGLDDSFSLVLVGRVGLQIQETIRRQAEKLGVADRVETTGQLGHDEAWSLASGALVGLSLLQPVPAYREAVATKLWEYMAIGLPPVVSDLPGQRRLIARLDPDLVTGSPEQAAAVVRELGLDPARRADLAKAARQLVEEAWNESRPDLVVQRVFEP